MQRLLLSGREREFVEIENARIIQAPLHGARGIDDGGLGGHLAEQCDAFFAGTDSNRASRVAEFSFAFEDRESGASRDFIDFERELGATGGGGGGGGDEAMLAWPVAVQKVEQTSEQTELGFDSRIIKRLDFKFGALGDAHDAEVGETDAGATAVAGASAIFGGEDLACIGGLPEVRRDAADKNVGAFHGENDGRRIGVRP